MLPSLKRERRALVFVLPSLKRERRALVFVLPSLKRERRAFCVLPSLKRERRAFCILECKTQICFAHASGSVRQRPFAHASGSVRQRPFADASGSVGVSNRFFPLFPISREPWSQSVVCVVWWRYCFAEFIAQPTYFLHIWRVYFYWLLTGRSVRPECLFL